MAFKITATSIVLLLRKVSKHGHVSSRRPKQTILFQRLKILPTNSLNILTFIEKGKTSAATRIVPLTDSLGKRLLEFCIDNKPNELVLGLDGKGASRWFSRIKNEYISTDSAKCFHSFRVMFSTALQQAGVEELIAAAMLGHKRGNTMTYGYYSKGYELKQLKDAYDKCVERIIW
jgi:integrase